MPRNSSPVSTKQQRLAELAKQSPQMGFTSLAYLMDMAWLYEAFQRTRKDGAAGVDGQTGKDYEKDLEANLRSLLDRAKSGTYRAPPVRDGVLTRLIGKWLQAGVQEDGTVTYPEAGSPQGGVISPVLSNIFLHYVLDEWFEQVVKSRLRGRAYLIRYADDFVIGFTDEKDARRVLKVLPQRFSKYGLTIHPDKTKLIPFAQPSPRAAGKGEGVGPQPGTFTLLGFTHYWGRSLKGNWVVKRKTASSRLSRAVRSIALWCRFNRHQPLGEQQHTLGQKLRGHFAYYGIT